MLNRCKSISLRNPWKNEPIRNRINRTLSVNRNCSVFLTKKSYFFIHDTSVIKFWTERKKKSIKECRKSERKKKKYEQDKRKKELERDKGTKLKRNKGKRKGMESTSIELFST